MGTPTKTIGNIISECPVARQLLQLARTHVHVAVLEQGQQLHHAVVHQVLDARLHQLILDVRLGRDAGHVIDAVNERQHLLRGQVPRVRIRVLEPAAHQRHLVVLHGRRVRLERPDLEVDRGVALHDRRDLALVQVAQYARQQVADVAVVLRVGQKRALLLHHQQILGELLHHRLVLDGPGPRVEHEAQVEVEKVPLVAHVIDAHRIADHLMAEGVAAGARKKEKIQSLYNV